MNYNSDDDAMHVSKGVKLQCNCKLNSSSYCQNKLGTHFRQNTKCH